MVNTLGWPGLRELQQHAIDPVMDREDCVLLAPTAGGKTEAATFPLLSTMAAEGWTGLSVLYVCPLRALLNNLHPRLETYTGWLGRSAGLWHGDTSQSRRQAMLRDRPDVLLTTPESLESMLVSTKVDARDLFRDLQAVVVDEVHAFAGDDRGWHLLGVLERLQHLAGRPIQRIGLSATVGNPDELLSWLQGSGRGERPSQVVGRPSPVATLPPPGDVTLDHVGSTDNAATVIAALHPGRKRLVFCQSRKHVEELTHALLSRGVQTFASHASLSRDERHRAEQAFAESRDCVIVSTSTLELGIDVGDLDHVLQLDSPSSVASFLQRIGRTGRRPGTNRNATILTTSDDQLLQAAGLLRLWGEGFIEPVVAPPEPRHIEAQQLLALVLQEGQVGSATWPEWWAGSDLMRAPGTLATHLLAEGLLDADGGMLHIGPEAEARYGRRHFMELMAVFTAAPEFTVLHGQTEIGSVEPDVLTAARPEGQPARFTLAGRAWSVTYVDWKRRRCFVEVSDRAALTRWTSAGGGLTHALARARRDVLLGADPPVTLSRRAAAGLARLREERATTVADGRLVVERRGKDVWWWTYAGLRANLTLRAALVDVVDPKQRPDSDRLRLLGELERGDVAEAIQGADVAAAVPSVDARAVNGLKFADVLPPGEAAEVLAARLRDPEGARWACEQERVWRG